MLNWIQVWRVGWVVGNIDIVACKKSLHYIRGVYKVGARASYASSSTQSRKYF